MGTFSLYLFIRRQLPVSLISPASKLSAAPPNPGQCIHEQRVQNTGTTLFRSTHRQNPHRLLPPSSRPPRCPLCTGTGLPSGPPPASLWQYRTAAPPHGPCFVLHVAPPSGPQPSVVFRYIVNRPGQAVHTTRSCHLSSHPHASSPQNPLRPEDEPV